MFNSNTGPNTISNSKTSPENLSSNTYSDAVSLTQQYAPQKKHFAKGFLENLRHFMVNIFQKELVSSNLVLAITLTVESQKGISTLLKYMS